VGIHTFLYPGLLRWQSGVGLRIADLGLDSLDWIRFGNCGAWAGLQPGPAFQHYINNIKLTLNPRLDPFFFFFFFLLLPRFLSFSHKGSRESCKHLGLLLLLSLSLSLPLSLSLSLSYIFLVLICVSVYALVSLCAFFFLQNFVEARVSL
jgi:hypothetical protein